MSVTPLPFSKDHERREKRALIIGEASRLFNENGYEATRHEDISGAIGLTKTSVSYYFESKEDIALECFGNTFDVLASFSQGVNPNDSALEKFLSVVRQFGEYWHQIHTKQRMQVAKVSHFPEISAHSQNILLAKSEPLIGFLLEVIERSSGDKSISPQNQADLLGYLYNVLQDAAEPEISMNQDDLEIYIDILRRGIARSVEWYVPNAGHAYVPSPVEGSGIFDRKARNRLKREAFIAAGIRHFNKTGFSGSGLSTIAKDLGVTRGAFYHLFKNKEELLRAAVENSLDVIGETMSAVRQQGGTGAQILSQSLLRCLTNSQLGAKPLIKFRMVDNLPTKLRNKYRSHQRLVMGEVRELIMEGQDDESLAEWSVEIVDKMVSGLLQHSLINGYCAYALKARGLSPQNPSDIPLAHVGALMNGLSGQSDNAD